MIAIWYSIIAIKTGYLDMEELLWCPERREWAFHFEQRSSQKRKLGAKEVAQQN